MNSLNRTPYRTGIALLGLMGVSQAFALNILPLGDSLVEGLCGTGSNDCTDPYLIPSNKAVLESYATNPGYVCGAFAKQIVEGFNGGNMGGFRGPLLSQLQGAGVSVTYKGHVKSGTALAPSNQWHEGHGGWSTRHIRACVDNYVMAQYPDTVLLEVGTNDLLGPDDLETSANNIKYIKDRIALLAPAARILIASIPTRYVSATPPLTGYVRDPTFESRRRILAQKVALKSDFDFPCTGRNLPDMNVLKASEMNTGNGGGMHPNSAGYTRMASIWAAALKAPECQFDTRTFVTLGGVQMESITAYGRYWLFGVNQAYAESGTLNSPLLARYQSICDTKPVCTFDTRMFTDSPSGPQENITAFNNYYNYSSAGALVSSGSLRSVARYNAFICVLSSTSNCVFDTRARAIRSGTTVETITAYGKYFDFNQSTNQFIASGALTSVPRYQQICSYKPATQTYCTFDTRTYVQLPGAPYMESVTAYGRYWNFNASTGALVEAGALAAVGRYKKPQAAAAVGFPDQGFSSGLPRVRTDYAMSNEGTAANPLTRGPTCLFAPCASGPNVFSQSNFWRQNWPSSCDLPGASCPFWVLGLNNEEASSTLNPGPPDVSLARSAPGSGIMGFSTLYGNANFAGDTLWRAHLVLNVSSGFNNPAPGATPFLSLGAWTGNGTPSTIGVLNPDSSAGLSVIAFGERLWGFTSPVRRYPTQDSSIASYLWVTAQWGTRPKMIALMLAHDHFKNSSATTVGHLNWNWNIRESVYYPGAEIVYIDVEDVVSHCGYTLPRLSTVGQEINYRIDPTRLFRCLGSHFTEPFPTTANLPITAVFWASEATGKDGGIWVDIHQMKMLSAAQAAASEDATSEEMSHPGAITPGAETAKIQGELERACLAAPDCVERFNAQDSRD